MPVVSPDKMNLHVEKLLDLIGAEFEPEQVKVSVEQFAKPNNCYGNVATKVQRDGGDIQYGWVIWQGEFICEAEHHAVWQRPDETLICITPRSIDVNAIMFVPDNSKVYIGKSFDNIRINITNNPIVDSFIEIAEINEALYGKYSVRKNDEVIVIPEPVNNIIDSNKALLFYIEQFIKSGGKMGSKCYCGSFKTYSNCHGKDIILKIKKQIERLDEMLQ